MSDRSLPDGEPGGRAACTVIAGPNGSGKSSLYDLLRPRGVFVNADVIARDARLGSLEAGRVTIARLRSLLERRADFVFETTLSSNHAVALMRDARRAGYEVGLVFVALADAELNVRRVRERVARGGHAIPEEDIRRRYPRAFANLAGALEIADGSLIYDNSGLEPVLLARVRGREIESVALDRATPHHATIARALEAAFSRPVEEITRREPGV